MARRLGVAAALGAGLALLAASPGAAQEASVAPAPPAPGAPAPARAPLLLNLMTRPTETPERAMQEALREDAKPRPATPDVEVLPDGSVRIGRTRVTVTVNEACPDDPIHALQEAQRQGNASRPRR